MTRDEVLLRAFPDLVNPDEPQDAYSNLGDIYSALAWRNLFWPDYFLVQGAVFLNLNGNDIELVTSRLHHNDSLSWKEFVDSFNFYELPYMLALPRALPEEMEECAYREVLQALRESWTARLATALPDHPIWISIDEPDEQLQLTLRLTLHQTLDQTQIT